VAIKKPLSFSVEAGSEITVLKTPYGIFAMVRS
jgi:nonsense-mediated mRNA decay protein 3